MSANHQPVLAYRLLERLIPPRLFLSLYPPLFGAGIRVDFVSANFREIRVHLNHGPLRQNYMGVHFGGSLYAMTDPFYMLMLYKNLGPEYVVWDTAATIRFVKAVKDTVYARFVLSESTIEEIRSSAEGGEKVIRILPVTIQTLDGTEVARVEKELYIRKRRAPV